MLDKSEHLVMNLELTSACPLRCSQCYCNLEDARHMSLETAKKWIIEAVKWGIKDIALSGGETLCYPHLYEVISYAKNNNLITNAAFSGWNFSREVVDLLQKSGLDNFFISLNGSTEKINAVTRQGYSHAVHALDVLKEVNIPNVYINWVMHANNANDFPQMVRLAEDKKVATLVIIGFKPDSRALMESVPSKAQMQQVVKFVKGYRGPVNIRIESCYSPLLALCCDTWIGNSNIGKDRGCAAGRGNISVNLNGTLSPCRHISAYETYDSIQEYYEGSQIIRKIRTCTEDSAEVPCSTCKYLKNCKPCMAISTEIYKRIFWGYPLCPLAE